MGTTSCLQGRSFFSRHSCYRAGYGSTVFQPTVDNSSPSGFGLEPFHCIWVLVLDREVLPLQPILPVPHL